MASGEFGGFGSQRGLEGAPYGGEPFTGENWGEQWTGLDEDRPVVLDDEQGGQFGDFPSAPARLQYPEHLAPEIGEE